MIVIKLSITNMTPAIEQLKRANIPFSIHQYQHDANASSFGLEAVEKLKLSAELVFKTLVVCTDTDVLAVAIVPVEKKLNLKAMAKAMQVKKVTMAEATRVQNSTGYVLGGVSPLGQKKSLTTIIDNSAQQCQTMFVSGGKRGLEIELSPSSLAKIIRANFCQISQ